MGFWGGIKGFGKALGETAKSVGSGLYAAPGLGVDLARAVASDNFDRGDAIDNLGDRMGGFADLLISDKTVTGAAMKAVGTASVWGYTNIVENPVQTAGAMQIQDVFSGDAWKRSWDAAQGTTLAQTSALQNAKFKDSLGGQNSLEGGIFSRVNHFTNPTSLASDAILTGKDLVPMVAHQAGVGSDASWDKHASSLSQTLKGIGQGGLAGNANLNGMDPLASDTWKKFASQSPLFASAETKVEDLTLSVVLDPTLGAGKVAKVAKAAALVRPISEEDRAAGLLNVMATETSKYGLKNAGLKTRVGQLNGEISQEAFRPGLIDKVRSASELHAALPQLNENVFGQQIASMLYDTKRIGATGKPEDLNRMVDTRNALYGAIYGDPAALQKLRTFDEGVADQMSNMVTDRVTGVADGQLADLAQADDIVSGKTTPFAARPETRVEVERQLFNQPEMVELLKGGIMADRDRTLGVTAAGMRSLARDRGQGIGRDLSAHTGYTALDTPANAVLEPIRQASSNLLQTKLGTIPVRLYNSQVGQLTADLVQLPWKASDALRTRVARGNLALADKNLTFELADGWMKSFYVDDATRGAALDSLMKAGDETARYGEMAKIQGIVQKAIGDHYGHDEEFTNAMIDSAGRQLNMATSQLNGSRYASTLSDRTNFDGKPLAVDTVLDEDGVYHIVPVLESDNVNRMPIPDFQKLDRMLGREGSYVRNRTKDWHRDPSMLAPFKGATEKGYNAAGTFHDWSLDVADEYMSIWKVGMLLRPAYGIRNTAEELGRHWAQGYAGITASILKNESIPARHAVSEQAATAYKAAKYEHQRLADLVGNNEADLKGALDELDGIEAGRTKLALTHDRLKGQRKRIETGDEGQTGFDAQYNASRQAKSSYEDENAARIRALKDLVGDHKKMVAQRDALDAALRTGKKAFAPDSPLGAGELNLLNGQTVPDAFGGNAGVVAKALTDAPGGGMLDTDFNQSANRVLAMSKQNTQFVSIHPSNPDHLAHWEVALNHQIRNSALARKALEGASPAEMSHWLKTSTTGKRLLRETPARRGDPDEWANDAWLLVNDYVPTDSLRQTLLERPVKTIDLDRAVHVSQRPAVHGQEIAMATGKGSTFLNMMNGAVAQTFKYVGDAPMQALSRHPLYMAYYRDAVDEISRKYIAEAQHTGSTFDEVFAAEKKARHVDSSALAAAQEKGLAAADNPADVVLSVDDLNKIQHKAHLMSRERMSNTVYNMASRSRSAEFLRFVAPFFAAHQDSVTFWAKAISDDPVVATRIMQVFDQPRRLGLVVDGNGNPVAPGSPIQDDHYILWQMPKAFGGPDPKKQAQAGLRTSESSGLLMLQGGGLLNPGFGPLVQTPMALLQTKLAGHESFEKIGKAVNPWGAPKGGLVHAVVDPNVSATMKRLETAVGSALGMNTGEYTDMLTVRARDLTVKFQQDHDGQAPTPAQQKKLLDDAAHDTKQMAWLRVVYSSSSPMSIAPQSKYNFFIGEYRRLQQQADQQNKGRDWADQRFMDLYGDSYFPLTRSASANRGVLNQTAGTIRELNANKSLVQRLDPTLWRMVVGSEGDGNFSGDARRALENFKVGPGSSDTAINQKNPGDILAANAAAQGWERWGQLNDFLNSEAAKRGLDSYKQAPDLVMARKLGKQDLADKNPSWGAEYGSAGKQDYEVLVDQMRTIAKDPKLSKDPARTDVQTLNTYLQARDFFKSQLEQRVVAGGAATMGAKSNADLQLAFNMVVSKLIESNTSFGQNFYDTVIDRDPFLDDTQIDAGGATQ